MRKIFQKQTRRKFALKGGIIVVELTRIELATS
jgi:hypothetical protein